MVEYDSWGKGGCERSSERRPLSALDQLSIMRAAAHSLVITLALTHEILEALGDTLLEPSLLVSPLGCLAGRRELGLGRDLGGRVWVLELGLSEDDVAVRAGGLVDLWVGDDEEDVLGPAEGDALDALDALEAEPLEGLAGLSLRTVDLDGGALGDALGVEVVADVEVLDGHGGGDGVWCVVWW
jgi:hypothetical protein